MRVGRHNGPVIGSDVTLVVPIKDTRRGKSRLALPAATRPGLALALALDTISAAARASSVLAVVETAADDRAISALAGVSVHRTTATDLNAAIADGLAQLPPDRPAGVLPGDLPGLDPAALQALLVGLGERTGWWAVADKQGIGTTLLVATRADLLRPAYGPGSYARHLAAGAGSVTLPASSTLRRDVDLPADLIGNLGPRSWPLARAAGLLARPA